MSKTATMPMFPLGMVLLPTMVVPIHVFEPRYRQMTRECLDGDGQFGVVLIERGSEVGGGDVRTDVGTAVRIIQSQEFPDGRWGLVVGGIRRIQISQWLQDDPYPRAEVQNWPDDNDGDSDDEATAAALAPVTATWRRVLAMQAELGISGVPATFELSDHPPTAVWQVSATAPVGPMDRQELLLAKNPIHRLQVLAEQLADVEELIKARIEMG